MKKLESPRTIRAISLLVPFLLILTTFFLFSAGCSRSRPQYKDSSEPIRVEAEQEFDIVLESNPTTGYHWKLAQPLDKAFLKLVKSEYKAPEDPALGKGGEEVWTFKGVEKGKTSISLKYVRDWEKNKPPAKTEIFKVTVR